MIHYLISHLERSTLNLNIRVGEWFSHQSAKLKREIFNEGSNPSTDSNFKFKNMAYIYCITNLINSKRYVGKTTTSIEERWKEHCYDFQKERCNKRPLYDAMNKYSVENFMIEELEYVDSNSELSEREIYWIKELGTYGSNGYNASKGGDGTILYNHSEIVELARLGYTSSQMQEKIGCCKDTIYKVLKANNIKIRKSNAKLIAQYDLAGNFIQVFFGSREAQEWLINNGITDNKSAQSHIIGCCKNKTKSQYGYIWKYLPEPI